MDFLQIFAGIGFNTTTVLSAILLCIIIRQLFRRDRRNLPPSPRISLPIIGHMHHMQPDMRKPFRKLRQRLGDVYSLQLGSRLTIIISGYKTLKEAFLKNADTFSNRANLFTLEAATQGKGFVIANGPRWKEHRRFVLSTLKDLGMGRRILEPKIQNEAAKLVLLFKDTDGKPFNPRPAINTTVANIISSMVFGDTFEHGEPLIGEMLDIVEMNMKNSMVAGVVNFFPFLRWLPGDVCKLKTIVNNVNKVLQFCKEIVIKHQQCTDKDSVDDFTNAYLRALEEQNLKGEDTSFSLDNLGGTIADLFFAGAETTTTALNWCLACMVEFPGIQQKLCEEDVEHLGEDRVASVADRPNLTYLEAFYMEVLRLCNIAPVLPSHTVSQDTQFIGYTIPKDAIIFLDLDSVLSDPSIWGDPERFRPERFLDEVGRLLKIEEFIPFFFGKRSCIGESLARMELFLILSFLIQNFEFKCPDNETVTYAAVDGSFGMTHAPKPFSVIAKQRQASL